MDVFDSEVKQREKNDYGFLLIPGNIVDNWKFVNAVDVAEVQLVVFVFCTACGENYRIFWQCFCKFGVVIS